MTSRSLGAAGRPGFLLFTPGRNFPRPEPRPEQFDQFRLLLLGGQVHFHLDDVGEKFQQEGFNATTQGCEGRGCPTLLAVSARGWGF